MIIIFRLLELSFIDDFLLLYHQGYDDYHIDNHSVYHVDYPHYIIIVR